MLSRDKKNLGAGILLAVSSLPSPDGIGTLGQSGFDFIDFLAAAGQRCWQLLPLCPVGEGNSPYKSPCGFAGEPLLIDLSLLARDGLLSPDELPAPRTGGRVDYDRVRREKLPLLQLAASRFSTDRADYRAFLRQNAFWLDDYALFTVIAEETDGVPPFDFPEDLRYRLPDALARFRLSRRDRIAAVKIIQFFFYAQYTALHRYAIKKRVALIGDIPFYVSPESADVWASPDCFLLGRDLTPRRIAGVPPDRFSKDGQLWGNPVYDWEEQKRTGYGWWKQRLAHCAAMYDILRIDHFRAFARYYSVPADAKDARGGNWERGPGMAFWNAAAPVIERLPIIAEDLGGEEQEVRDLIRETGFPCMKVLQFGFDKGLSNPFLPDNFDTPCVCYTGTHDNNTALGWYESASLRERVMFDCIAPGRGVPVSLRMIALGMASCAEWMIVPMQDWLCLGAEHRMNVPGTKSGNWEWRMPPDALNDALLQTVIKYSRCGVP